MSKVPLRVYCSEIEDAIDQKQIEESIAHCHQILKSYPKHIETYRLLGKAYLESQRYGNAADLFQRVLSSVPDDFISQLGMSIIREDESNLDAAIWHMERAFENQPYNSGQFEKVNDECECHGYSKCRYCGQKPPPYNRQYSRYSVYSTLSSPGLIGH